MRLELAQTFAVGSAHPTIILYLIMLEYLTPRYHRVWQMLILKLEF